MSSPERRSALSLLRSLSQARLDRHLILGGSSGLFAASPHLPALTEDLDFLVDADWLAAHEGELLAVMPRLGFEHHAGTCTFTDARGGSLDLVGYSTVDRNDRIGGGVTVPVMVYGDLSTVLSAPGSVVDVPGGGRALSPAALAAVKLLTVRVEKGGKDKVQALLLVDENSSDAAFLAELAGLLRAFPADRVDDALADAQAAFLALDADPFLSDPQSSGYVPLKGAAERGLRRLQQLRADGGLR